METLERILGEHEFFCDLDKPYLHLIVGCASNVRFEAGAYLFREGEEANRFYLIRHGRVALEIIPPQRPPIIVETLEGGDILGWSWLVPPHFWRLDARALEQVRAIALDGACLRKKCEENHDLGYELLKRFALIMEQRVQSMRLQLVDMYAVPR